jgi:tRNA (cytidine32/uridine32-2'-O)-methyltransferase
MSAPPPIDLRIILVETSHPGNIGAAARAMKNMGLEQLTLVRPRSFPDPEATARASGADDVLANARVVGSVAEAVADCGLVAATTSRDRDHFTRVLDLKDAAPVLVRESQRGPAAVLFGNERAGLANEEVALAHLLLRIPANPVYPSLNLAMAVQLVSYELYRARGAEYPVPANPTPLAAGADLARLYEHWQQVMDEVDFRDRTSSGVHLMNRVHRMFQRAELDKNEVNILRGFLTSIQQKRRVAGPRN